MLPVNLQGVCHLRTPDRLMGVFPSCSEETTLPDAFQSVAVADNSIIILRKCRAPPLPLIHIAIFSKGRQGE